MKKIIALLIAALLVCASTSGAESTYKVKNTGKRKYPRIITVNTNGQKKKYKAYDQTGFNSAYLSQRGCAHTAAAIIMSAYNKPYTPYDIHYGSVNKKCSERYALKKNGKRAAVTGQSLSIFSISKILKNAGIKNHPVYKYKEKKAVKEITNNLERGQPVIVMCHRKKVKGVKLANSYHMIVLAGIDKKGNVIAINPAGGTVDRSHCTGDFKLTVKQIVHRHMWSCKGNKYKNFYFNGSDNYGGYIIIDE